MNVNKSEGVGKTLDIHERLSHLSSTHGAELAGYKDGKTPIELEDGALREGGALNLLSREAMGLFAQYAAVGVIYGLLPNLSSPLYQNYLQMEGYQVQSYIVLVNMGWSFKLFMGLLTDCFPLFGYRRKPYMVIGWSVCMICLAVMTFTPFEDAFYQRADLYGHDLKKINATDTEKFINLKAPDSASKFIILSCLASFGYVLADVAADAMVVQYAQREPEEIRGRVQTSIYFVRTVFSTFSLLVTGFLMNGFKYGGSFEFNVSPNVVYAIALVPCVLAVITTLFVVVEAKTPKIILGEYMRGFWELLKLRVMWQICAFRFISNIFFGFGSTPASGINTYWAKVEPLTDSIFSVVGNILFATVLFVCGKWGLAWNWRITIASTSICIILIDSTVVFITIWDVIRSQYFYLGVFLSDNLPSSVRFIVATYCSVEIADLGNEGAVYGLVTTVNNLASPVAAVIYKLVDSFFAVSTADIKRDDIAVRWEVTYCYIISYTMKLLSLVWLFMLPPQKKEIQELKRTGGKSFAAALGLSIIFLFSLSFSVMTNILSIFKNTKCLRIAGGKGCP